MSGHRCSHRGERDGKGKSTCTPANNQQHGGDLYVIPVDADDPDKGTHEVCYAHLPRPLWNQSTCTHSHAPSGVCTYCGARV